MELLIVYNSLHNEKNRPPVSGFFFHLFFLPPDERGMMLPTPSST
jgi:hypothetical protein